MDNIEQHVQDLFQQARQQPSQSTSDEVFGHFLSSLGSGSTGIASSIFNLKHLIIMLSFSAFIASIAIWGSMGSANSQTTFKQDEASFLSKVATSSASTSDAVATNNTVNVEETKSSAVSDSGEIKDISPIQRIESVAPIEKEKADIPVIGGITPNELQKDAAPQAGFIDGKTSDQGIDPPVVPEPEIIVPDTTLEGEEEAEKEEEGTIISYVITTNSTFEELEKIASEAHKAGLMMRYDLKIRKDKIKKMTLYLRFAGDDPSCYNNTHIVASGTFIRNIGWLIDANGKAIKILK